MIAIDVATARTAELFDEADRVRVARRIAKCRRAHTSASGSAPADRG